MRERRTTALLAPDARAPAEARALVDALTVGHDVEVRFAARLLVSELVANAVRHAALAEDATIRVECIVDEAGVRASVDDPGRGIAAALLAPLGAAGAGLGLVLLRDLAASSHVESDATGTRARFTVAARDAAPGAKKASLVDGAHRPV